MRRPILHAVAIVALLALGGLLQYGLHRPWGGYHDLGWWLWVPAAVAVVLGVGCAVGGFLTERGGVGVPAWVLVVPAGVAGLAGLAWVSEMGWLVEQLGESAFAGHHHAEEYRRITAAIFHSHQKAYLALTWGGIGFGSIAVMTGCRPPPLAVKPGIHKALFWRAITLGALVTVGVLFVWWCRYTAVSKRLQYTSVSDTLDAVREETLGLLMVDGGWMMAPLLAGVAATVLMPLVLLSLWPRQNPLDENSAPALVSARALGSTAALAMASTLGLAVLVKSSPSMMGFWMHMTSHGWEYSVPARSGIYPDGLLFYRNAVICTLLIIAAGLVVVMPLLATTGQRTRRWIAPLGIALLCMVGLGLSRGVATASARHMFDPNCTENCLHRDQLAALLCLGRFKKDSQMLTDRCESVWLPAENADFRLPRVAAKSCPQTIASIVHTERTEIAIQRRTIHDLVDWGIEGALGPDSGVHRLRHAVEMQVETGQEMASRSPYLAGSDQVLFALDARTPMGFVDRIRWSAYLGGSVDQLLVVQAQDSSPIPRYRTVSLDRPPGDPHPSPWRPLLAESYWKLHIGVETITVTTPDGTIQTATDATTLATQLRGSLIAPGTAPLWVTHDPEVTLGQELEARATLTGKGLFIEAYSLPFGTGGQPLPELL